MSGVYTVSIGEDRQTGYIIAPSYSAGDEARFPEVPDSTSVNIAALTVGDPEPKFVTRPLAILNEVSENGLLYNQAIFDGVYQQTVGKPARRGHISEADKSSAFPPDEGYWVGVLIDSLFYGKPTVFGKCYLVHDTPLKNMVLRREAVGGTISNSLWGDVIYEQDSSGYMEPAGVRIESVDFVPKERAALQSLGGAFVVTSEMKESIMDVNEQAMAEAAQFKKMCAEMKPEALHEALHESGKAHGMAEMHLKAGSCAECSAALHEMLDKGSRKSVAESYLKEATAEETYGTLSEAVRSHVANCYAQEKGMNMTAKEDPKKVEEGLAEMTSFRTQLAEMQTAIKALSESNQTLTASNKNQEAVIKQYQRQDFERELDAQVDVYFTAVPMKTPKGMEGLAQLKRTMRKGALAEMAGMENGQIAANIKAACDVEWEGEVKGLAEMFYASVSGPAAVTGQSGPGAMQARTGIDPATGRYSDDFVRNAAMTTGVLGGRAGGVK